MTRYYLSWQSNELYEKLEARAKADGTYSEDNDDWYEPEDIELVRDARGILEDAYFGTVEIHERIPDDEIPGSYDTRFVEDVEAT